MNPNIPYTAFLHNPAIWEELCRYCESLPNYAQTYGEKRSRSWTTNSTWSWSAP